MFLSRAIESTIRSNSWFITTLLRKPIHLSRLAPHGRLAHVLQPRTPDRPARGSQIQSVTRRKNKSGGENLHRPIRTTSHPDPIQEELSHLRKSRVRMTAPASLRKTPKPAPRRTAVGAGEGERMSDLCSRMTLLACQR